MMALGNRDFVMVMRLCGLQKSFEVATKEDALQAFEKAGKDELVLASAGVLRVAPELEMCHNVVSLPERLHEFSRLDDLNKIIVAAVGSAFELEEKDNG